MKRLIAGQKYQLAYILTIGILYYILCHLAPITLSDHVLYKFGMFNYHLVKVTNKTHKSFRERRILVFQPNFSQNSVFTKIEVIFF